MLWNLIQLFTMNYANKFWILCRKTYPKSSMNHSISRYTSSSRFLMSCCQTVEGYVRIKHSNTWFNTRWKAYLTWQYSRNNRYDLSKMVHARILTLFRNVGSLRKKKGGNRREKRNLLKCYGQIWTVAKERNIKPRNKRVHRIS